MINGDRVNLSVILTLIHRKVKGGRLFRKNPEMCGEISSIAEDMNKPLFLMTLQNLSS